MNLLKRIFRKEGVQNLVLLDINKSEVEKTIKELESIISSIKLSWKGLERIHNTQLGEILDPPYYSLKEAVERIEEFLPLFKKLKMCIDCEFLRFRKRILYGWMSSLDPVCIYRPLKEDDRLRDADYLAFKDEIEGIWGCPLGRWEETE